MDNLEIGIFDASFEEEDQSDQGQRVSFIDALRATTNYVYRLENWQL